MSERYVAWTSSDEKPTDPVAEARARCIVNMSVPGSEVAVSNAKALDALIAAVRAEEREACAKVALDGNVKPEPRKIAATIRQRGEGANGH